MRHRTVSILLMAVLLGGCSSKSHRVSVAQKPLPAWYVHPPKSDAATLYETGEGIDKRAAVNDALDMMAANLSVTIASQYQSEATETRHDGDSSATFSSRNLIRSEVKKIRISNYRVVQESAQGFRRYLVLVTAEKRDIALGLKNELDATYSLLRERERNLVSADALTRFFFYGTAAHTASETENTRLILKLLEPHFDDAPYLRAQSEWEGKRQQLQQRIRFAVESTAPLARTLAPVIREGITEEKLILGASGDENQFVVTIDAHAEKTMAMGFYLARTAVVMRVADHRGNVIGSRSLQLVGQSSQSEAVAEQSVAAKLKKVMENEGVFPLLGVQTQPGSP